MSTDRTTETTGLEALASSLRDAVIEHLKADGWQVCPPNHCPLPRNRTEAEAMNIISSSFLAKIQ